MDFLSCLIILALLVLLVLVVKKSYFRTHAFQNKYEYKTTYTGDIPRLGIGREGSEYLGGGSVSPFGLKIETYCKFANITYEYDPNPDFITKNPKHKFPYLEHKGNFVPDSSFIVDYLKQHFVDLDKELTEEQKAQTLLIQRTVEEHLYWSLVYFRWSYRDDYFDEISTVFFWKLPKLLRPLVFAIIRKNMYDSLYGHGIGRHTVEEIKQLADQDLKCLSVLLGSKQFLLGTSHPTSIDAVVYGFCANVLYAPPADADYPLRKLLKQ